MYSTIGNKTASWYLSTYRGCYALKCVFYLVDTTVQRCTSVSVNKRKIYAFIMFFVNNYHMVKSPVHCACFIMEMFVEHFYMLHSLTFSLIRKLIWSFKQMKNCSELCNETRKKNVIKYLTVIHQCVR